MKNLTFFLVFAMSSYSFATNTGSPDPFNVTTYYTTTKPTQVLSGLIIDAIQKYEESAKYEEAARMKSIILSARLDAIEYVRAVQEERPPFVSAALASAISYVDPNKSLSEIEVVKSIVVYNFQYAK